MSEPELAQRRAAARRPRNAGGVYGPLERGWVALTAVERAQVASLASLDGLADQVGGLAQAAERIALMLRSVRPGLVSRLADAEYASVAQSCAAAEHALRTGQVKAKSGEGLDPATFDALRQRSAVACLVVLSAVARGVAFLEANGIWTRRGERPLVLRLGGVMRTATRAILEHASWVLKDAPDADVAAVLAGLEDAG